MCISFRVMRHIELSNDFIVRKEALDHLPVPLVFQSWGTGLLWINKTAQEMGFTLKAVQQQLADRHSAAVPWRLRVNHESHIMQEAAILNLEGDRQGTLYWPMEVLWNPAGKDLHTGIALAQDKQWVYVNEVAERVLGLSEVEQWTWNAVSWLPQWSDAVAKGSHAVLVSQYDDFEVRIRGVGQWVVLEAIPKPLVQHDMISANTAATLMHEVRNPLASLLGYIELAQLEQPGGSIAGYLEKALEEITRLTEITEDILWVTRDTVIHRELVELEPLLWKNWNKLQVDGIVFKLSCPSGLQVWADAMRLDHIFTNLFKNAIEAMADRHKSPRVVVSAVVRETTTQISVEDNGPGIPQDIMAHLFHVQQSTKEGGSGLGLMIVRKLVQTHQGALAIESKPGRTVIRMEFPNLEAPA
ncbi:MAG: ATP-binding protein [Sulfobacillus sp.]